MFATALVSLHGALAQAPPIPNGTAPQIQEETQAPKKPEAATDDLSDDDTQEEAVDTDNAQSDKTTETAETRLPEISYDLDALPFPARRMRELILEATKSGKLENLRPYIGTGDNMTMLSLGGIDGDPIEFLKRETGDENGHEILAILEEVLEAGYVHIDKGTEQELYVWPYFFAYPLEKLNDKQMVELFRIVTYGDFQDMKDFGGYIFYRVGITPTGRWSFFVAGD